MVLGIPTRSDAIALSHEYKDALEFDAIIYELLALGRPDGVFDETFTAAESTSAEVYAHHLQRVSAYMQVVIDNLTRLGLDTMTSHGVSYPQRLIFEVLSSGVRCVTAAFSVTSDDDKCIATMREAMRSVNRSDAMKLARTIFHTDVMHAYEIERNPKHQVGFLVEANENIAERSDFALSFGEDYFSTKSNDITRASIPAFGLLDAEHRRTFEGLRYRQLLRDEINTLATQKGSVVINGTTYTPKIHAGMFTYEADGESYTQIANLFGVPVYQARGPLLRPESWVNGEVRMVERYRDDQSHAAAQPLVTHYEFDEPADNQLSDLLPGAWKPSLS